MRLTNQITPRAVRWHQTSGDAHLLNHFEQVCNLVNAAGEVLTLQLPPVPLGPFSLQVDVPVWEGLCAGSRIVVANGRLHLGEQTLQPNNALLWNPLPDWATLSSARFATYSIPLPPLLEDRFKGWLAALAEGGAAVGAAVAPLAGLGTGLTPSGDDLLLGSLYALRVRRWASTRLVQIAEEAAARTTTLSAAFLRAAAAGEALEPWHKVCAGEETAVEEILTIGARSGKEAWMGFTHALHSRISF